MLVFDFFGGVAGKLCWYFVVLGDDDELESAVLVLESSNVSLNFPSVCFWFFFLVFRRSFRQLQEQPQ